MSKIISELSIVKLEAAISHWWKFQADEATESDALTEMVTAVNSVLDELAYEPRISHLTTEDFFGVSRAVEG